MVYSQQRGSIEPPEGSELGLVDSVEAELVGQSVGNADEPAEAVGQGAVEIEDDQFEPQGILSTCW